MWRSKLIHHRRFRAAALLLAILVAAGVFQTFDVNPAASQTVRLTAYQASKDPGMDPKDGAWSKAIPIQVPLTAQGAAYPTGGGSIPTVTARALHFEGKLYIRLEWKDSTLDDSTSRVQDFSDAAAVEFPASSASTVPSICMGQANAGVNIWQWRADTQAGIKPINEKFPNMLVDESVPAGDDTWFTARAAGNPYAHPEIGPVQTLIAQAFGSLSPSAVQDAHGNGIHENGRWAVVFERALTGADGNQATFTQGAKTDMAFAIWNGSDGDRNGRKSVSQFVQLAVAGVSPTGGSEESWPFIMAAVLLAGLTALGIGLATFGVRGEKR